MALRLGLGLATIGTVAWCLVPATPLWAESAAEAGSDALVLFVASEVLFWGGVAVAGRDAYTTLKQRRARELPGALWRALRTGRAA